MKNLLLLLLFLLTISSCQDKRPIVLPESHDLISKYLNERVAPYINIDEDIVLRFKKEVNQSSFDAYNQIRFSPHVDGKFSWIDAYTVVFHPNEHLEFDQGYSMSVDVQAIDTTVTEPFALIVNFKTRALHLSMNAIYQKLEANGTSVDVVIKGAILSNQQVESSLIEKMLSVRGGGQLSDITWDHNASGKVHDFTITGLSQQSKQQELEVVWDGEVLVDGFEGRKRIVISGEKSFAVDDVIIQNEPSRYITILFSQPIDTDQNLNGLIKINDNNKNIKTLIEGNELKIYPDGNIERTIQLELSKSIKSYTGKTLAQNVTRGLNIEPAKPALRLAESGVIVPSIGDITFPFEAINIDTVDIEIFKIYDQNVLQFMQENDLSGGYSLDQVGVIVHQEKKSIKTEGQPINTWMSIALDLRDFMMKDQDAVYQVRLGYRPSYVNYQCASGIADYPSFKKGRSIMEYRYYGYEGYEDPCSKAYYTTDKFVSRNVLISNVAAIIKRDGHNKYYVVANKISDGQSLSGADVSFYDFQKKSLGNTSTSSVGMAEVKLEKTAAFAIIKHSEGVAYVNLRDANTKSITDFNTGGKKSKKGIDAYLYTDRGVYRPGDSIYLHAMIEDGEMDLPDDHPVTLVVKDAQSQVKYRHSTTTHMDHIYSFAIPTDMDDGTGAWSASLGVGSVSFSKRINVETVKPNRLRIALEKDDRISYVKKDSRMIDIVSSWLHGAPASGLKVKIDGQWSVMSPRFEGFRDYIFSDPARKINGGQVTLFEGALNDTGERSFELQLDKNSKYPAMLRANITSRVFEKGGDFSENYSSIEVSPYATYVGVSMPENSWGYKSVKIGGPGKATAIVVNENGSPAVNRRLSIGVYDINWRWWYYRGERNNIYELNSDQHTKAIIKADAISGANGKVEIPFSTDEFEYGRKLIRICDVDSGHCTGEFFYASGWRSSMTSEERSSLSRLAFTADSESYTSGDEVTLSIPSEAGSKILVSIESENEVVLQDWITGTKGSSTYKFRTDKLMAPNVYAHVSLIQPYDQVTNDLPIRMYGVIPIMIEDPESKLDPEIKVADSFKPEQPFSISVSEADGKAMTYTLAVVDEGLLDLTNYKTPSPHGHFFAKRSLGVKTWDVYDDVLYGLNGTPDKIISVGGDGENEAGDGKKKAIRFKPVVFSAGPFFLKSGADATHSFTMPNYIGSVRTMVIARSGHSYGRADEATPVKTPLMLLPTVPRVISQGEKIKIPVSVFGMQDDIKNVQVDLATSGHLSSPDRTQALSFRQQGEQVTYFDASVGEELGIAKIDVSATSGRYKASQQIEVDVRNPNPVVSEVNSHTLEAGETWTTDYNPFGVAGTNDATIELSLMPSVRLADRVDYLVNYPYGCLEQTTSSAFAQLYLKELTDYVSDAEIDRNIKAGIKRILKLQNGRGGFKYWPSSRSKISEWSSSYAGHFLIKAKEKGYYVANSVIDNWASDQKLRASRWTPSSNMYRRKSDMINQGYRLYTLAMYGQPDLSAMNNLRGYGDLPATAKFLLAASYAINGKSNIALDLIKGASNDIATYRSSGWTYGSEVRDMSLIAQTLRHLDRTSQSLEVIKNVVEKLNGGRWYSTQSIAFGLMTIGELSEEYRRSTIDATVTTGSDSPIDVEYNKTIFTMGVDPDDATDHRLVIKNNSDKVLFASVQLKGQKSTANMLTDPAVSKNVSLKVNYKSLDGKSIDVSSLKQGTDFIAEIEIVNTNTSATSIDEMALTQIIPSGWEIRSGRLSNLDGFSEDSYDYRDIRDDRVHTFFDLTSKKKYVLLMNATYEGEYFLPPVSVEAMYDNGVQARTKGRKIRVVSNK